MREGEPLLRTLNLLGVANPSSELAAISWP